MAKKIIFIVMDGLGDRPIKGFGGKTPLEAAHTPNMDALAAQGATGLMYTVGEGIVPESDTAHLSLFGYELDKYYPGRGPFEAAGVGIEVKPGDVAWRCNLGTVDEKGVILDRRAGRIESTAPFAAELDGTEVDGIRFIVKPGTAYRMALVMRGHGLSAAMSPNDPHRIGEKIMEVKAEDGSKEAEFSAGVMNRFLQSAYRKIAANPVNEKRKGAGKPVANCMLCRGAGFMKKIPGIEERYGMRACCIAGAGLYKGVGRILGMDVLETPGANGLPSTDVDAKICSAISVVQGPGQGYDFVFVHIKAADSLGEDGNPQGKKEFIEKADSAFGGLLGLKDAIVVVTADHSTPCEEKAHSADPVPVLVSGHGVEGDAVQTFSERACKDGALGLMKNGGEFMQKLMGFCKK